MTGKLKAVGGVMSMKFEKLGTQRNTVRVRVPHSWHAAYAAALRESDPTKLIGRIEYAISAIEGRHSEWETYPGTSAELTAIRKCIRTQKLLMTQNQHGLKQHLEA
jgi:hypothetical protein